MAEPASDRSPFETLVLAGLGALALATERADGLADQLASRFGIDRDEMRDALRDALESWRREAGRVGDGTEKLAARVAEELGLVVRANLEDFELRVAQLEHRLKLLERQKTET